MKLSYIQSEENYKGFTLKVVMTSLGDLRYHRTCEVWKDGERISIGKTKKEVKVLIAEGYIK